MRLFAEAGTFGSGLQGGKPRRRSHHAERCRVGRALPKGPRYHDALHSVCLLDHMPDAGRHVEQIGAAKSA